MTDPTQTAGTPEQDGGDAAATPTAGTPVADDRNAGDGINRDEALVWKSKAEKYNEVETELKLAQARLDALTRAQSPAARGSDPRAERREAVRRFADGTIGEGPDPVAGEVLDLRQEFSETIAELLNKQELEKIADPEKRDKTTKLFIHNRHLYGTPAVALAQVERDENARKLAEAEAERDKLRKALEAQTTRPKADVVQTHAREVSAAEHADIMTQAQWSERQAELERRYDAGDLEAGKLRRAEQAARVKGKLRIEG